MVGTGSSPSTGRSSCRAAGRTAATAAAAATSCSSPIDAVNGLGAFRYQKQYKAARGGNGASNKKHGRNGADLELSVPTGTIVRNAETGDVIGDLVEPGARLVIAQGGRGGRGNQHFASPSNQAPHISETGQRGETLRLDARAQAHLRRRARRPAERRQVDAARRGLAGHAEDRRLPVHHARAEPRRRRGRLRVVRHGRHPRPHRRRPRRRRPRPRVPPPRRAHAPARSTSSTPRSPTRRTTSTSSTTSCARTPTTSAPGRRSSPSTRWTSRKPKPAATELEALADQPRPPVRLHLGRRAPGHRRSREARLRDARAHPRGGAAARPR